MKDKSKTMQLLTKLVTRIKRKNISKKKIFDYTFNIFTFINNQRSHQNKIFPSN